MNTQSTLQVRALAGNSEAIELLVYGPIGSDEWSAAASVAAADIVRQLSASTAREITVRINSPGGSVADALAIHSALRSHPSRKNVIVDGIAASAASLVAAAGDDVAMAQTTLLMIHAPWSMASGNAIELRQFADVLDRYAEAMATAYARKTGRPAAEVMRLLTDGEDHYFNPAEAVAFGLADRVLDEAPPSQSLAAPAAASIRQGLRVLADRAPTRYRSLLRTLTNPQKETPMNSKTEPQAGAPVDPMAALRDRNFRIRDICKSFSGQPHIAALEADALADPAVTLDQFHSQVFAALAANCPGPLTPQPRASAFGSAWQPEREDGFVQAAADALAIRAGIRVAKPHPAAADLRNTSVQDLARASLSRAGRSHRDLSGHALIQAALTSGDFGNLLSNALGKAVRAGYESDVQSHAAWVRFTQVNDFRTQTRPILGAAPALDKLLQLESYKQGGWAEDSASFALEKFGKLFAISWEALLADDLAAFQRVPQALGAAARRAEADAVYLNLTAGAGAGVVMQDGQPLFHSTHNNIVATASFPDSSSLGAARALLRRQRPVGNVGFLNLQPAFLIVPPELETAAEILIASASRHVTGTSGSTTDGVQTPWIANLTLVVEPRLSGFWYVAASTAQIDTVECATLSEANGAPIVEELVGEGATNDSIVWKVRHPLAARALDWRGVARVAIPT
jgi:ATP-dependent protease ClpP protease subunit